EAKALIHSEDEVGMVALALNTMSSRLAELFHTLETRVSERTRDLEVAAEVAKQVTKALELNYLLWQVVERTRISFNLYETSVLLYDEKNNNLRLVAASGDLTVRASDEPSEIIHLNQTQGLLARAVVTKSIVLENDVSMAKDYLAHPKMPNLRAELVLPMMNGHHLLGVLDVQHDHVDGFSKEDLRVFTSLADQIAIAIRNAQLFVEMQDARREREALFQISEAMNAATTYVGIVDAIAKVVDPALFNITLSIFENYDREQATYLETVATCK